MNLLCPVSPGELLDKITILEIKKKKITDSAKSKNIQHELTLLKNELKTNVVVTPKLTELIVELERVNLALWNIEDDIREYEADRRFDDNFIQLARSVYKTNDRRSQIKYRVNALLQSTIVEEKSYRDY